MTFEAQYNFYPFGTQYYREPTPLPSEWDTDLREIAKAGYTHIQLRPQWVCHERIRGHETWDDIDRLFELAQKHGLRVILKPMLECAPDWVYSELDGYRIGFGGQRISPEGHGAFYAGGWLPCFDNPEVRQAAAQFVQHIVSRYRQHPALWFYNAWNEPRSRPMGQCQCKHSIQNYRQWLQRRFGDIDALNNALGKYWSSYDAVQPPQSAWDYVQMYLWRQWAADAVAGHVKLVADAIKSVDADAFVMTHVGCCSMIQDPCSDASDDQLNRAAVDRYGTSYPVNLHPYSEGHHCTGDLISDWLRHVDPSYWCHEFYPNEGCWSVPPSADVLNRLVWLAVSGGAAGFTFWQYRSERVGNETNGYGMRNIDGTPTPRSEVCDAIAGVLRQHGADLVASARVPSRVNVLYNREADVMARVQSLTHDDIHLRGNSLESGGGSSYKQSVHGAHRAYLMAGETVDFITPGDDLDGISYLHIAADEMLSDDDAQWLRDYVYRGGKLVVEMPFACRDANTWVSTTRPRPPFRELLGCIETERVVCHGDRDHAAGFDDGTVSTAVKWKVSLQPTSGCAVAHWADGTAAAVLNKYGSGSVLTLGVNISMGCGSDSNDPAVMALCRVVNRYLQTDIGQSDTPNGVWIRKRSSDNKEIWFIFNLTEQQQTVCLPNEPVNVWQTGGTDLNELSLVIPAGATWVARMR